MNRKRKEDESFEDYRENQKVEAKELKEKLKRRIIWTACIIMPDASKKDLPEYLRPLVKLPVRGAFNRFKGHSMPNSLHEKRRRERMLDKLQKQGVIA